MYQWLIQYLKNKKFEIIKVPIRWNYHTLTQNAEEFKKFFLKNKKRENYILGFSYGAVLTLLTANVLKPRKIYLCSLSPDFNEDRTYMKKWEKRYIGKRRYTDTKTRDATQLAKELEIPSVVFYGEKEGEKYPQLKLRCEETSRLAKNSKLIVVKNASHNLADFEYQKAIKSILN